MLCGMLWYATVWNDEWEYIGLYATEWDFYALVWDVVSMQCYDIPVLCYGMVY